jgi:hypothetical protein
MEICKADPQVIKNGLGTYKLKAKSGTDIGLRTFQEVKEAVELEQNMWSTMAKIPGADTQS